MHVDFLSSRFQLGHVDGIRIESSCGHIGELAGDGCSGHIAVSIFFFRPADGNSFIRGIPGNGSIDGSHTGPRIIPFYILIGTGFGIFPEDDGIGPPGIASGPDGNGVFSPGSAVLSQGNGIGRSSGTTAQSDAIIPPGSASAQRNRVGPGGHGSGTHCSRLGPIGLGPIPYGRPGIGGFGGCSYPSTLFRHIGIISQGYPILPVHSGIGADGRGIAGRDMSSADGRGIGNGTAP